MAWESPNPLWTLKASKMYEEGVHHTLASGATTNAGREYAEHGQWRIQRGGPWVPWNPPFEGLPSKILCANVLSTLRSHYQKHVATIETMSKASERIKDYSCNAPSAARDGDMLSVWERLFAASAARSGGTPLILRASNTTTRFSSRSSNFAVTPRVHWSQKVSKIFLGGLPPLAGALRAL